MTTLFKTKAIIYDMDGVLVDSEPLWKRSEQQVLAQYGIDPVAIKKKHHLVTTGMRIDETIDLYRRLYPHNKISTKDVTKQIIDIVIEKITATKPIMSGVINSLVLCQSLGLKIGLASSSPMPVIDAVTDSLNITHYFNQRVSAEYLEYGKPDPRVYLFAAKKLVEDRLNCVTIEDSIAGMIATKAARMKSIVVPDKKNVNHAHWCIADIKLLSLLELNAKHLV